ncbi:aminoacyl-tRNA hydrolase [Mycoplasmopsis columbina]|uniref:Peptidyl-tRNA hydrolase n=1 Tax=Mycoplasmopsis columbina SF7 TaxID=1037410 RepID=F9UJ87_9BACT|nr:aminoacyl-tRNA hydrolase [Mycoplasmopsis columbina]EGV00583.1 peptidyl-tRNA hydrolase [Mycoplasmopsis columbina SF7]VEU77196.1 aminoacyl-tRNA hydrolase [Mycoplasmopsis columbina]
MKLIVGLGNPGKEYQFTRHNAGYLVIDKILNKLDLKLNKEKFNGRFVLTDDLIIAKPETYMNNSGMFVQNLCQFYKINPSDVIVIYDEKDFELGQAAIKIGGSSAGHNGIESVRVQLNNNEFKRLRIGIGSSRTIPLRNYVLSNFTLEEMPIFEEVANVAADAAISFAFNDIKVVMDKFNVNRKKKNITGN